MVLDFFLSSSYTIPTLLAPFCHPEPQLSSSDTANVEVLPPALVPPKTQLTPKMAPSRRSHHCPQPLLSTNGWLPLRSSPHLSSSLQHPATRPSLSSLKRM